MGQAFFLKGLTVEFNKRRVVDIEEFGFSAGKIHAIIGPSGAGKSTLLRVLNLLQKPGSGYVYYFGKLLPNSGRSQVDFRRTMAVVFQKPSMFSGSVYYNVALGLRLRGSVGREEKEEIRDALEKVGLQEFAGRSAATLSGGEAQRIALARALVVKPKVLLLDEPTANLDPANVSIFEDVINKVHQDTGTTVIIITHNLHQAKRLSQETVFMNKGRIIEAGVTSRLFNDPQVASTRQFVSGEMVY